jgi:hypothetical protein
LHESRTLITLGEHSRVLSICPHQPNRPVAKCPEVPDVALAYPSTCRSEGNPSAVRRIGVGQVFAIGRDGRAIHAMPRGVGGNPTLRHGGIAQWNMVCRQAPGVRSSQEHERCADRDPDAEPVGIQVRLRLATFLETAARVRMVADARSAAAGAALTAAKPPESLSRFKRFRSERMSAALW